SHVHARAHDVFKSRSELLQRALNISQALLRLLVRVTNSHDLAVNCQSRRASDVNAVADFDRARVANNRFPLGAGRDAFAFGHLCKTGAQASRLHSTNVLATGTVALQSRYSATSCP